jgi:hypothetical protein
MTLAKERKTTAKPLISNGGGFRKFSIYALWKVSQIRKSKPRNPSLLIAATVGCNM